MRLWTIAITLFALLLTLPTMPRQKLLRGSIRNKPFLRESRITAVLADAPMSVTLQSDNNKTIKFNTQNGQTVDGSPSQSSAIPHLVLRRNGVLTKADERTLTITVSGLKIPPPGIRLSLRIETQHVDPDSQTAEAGRLLLWQESRQLMNFTDKTLSKETVQFFITFEDTSLAGGTTIPTPTGYFRYDIWVTTIGGKELQAPLYALAQDHAFLMENQWVVPLPAVEEDSPSAAWDELIISYCDMFPFGSTVPDPSSRLKRSEITPFVANQLAPAFVEAYRVQTQEWGFPGYHQLSGNPAAEYNRRLSIALAAGKTWYHGRAPLRGHAGISLQTTRSDSATQEDLLVNLTDVFHHELFHNLQAELSHQLSGADDMGKGYKAWALFTEGTAVVASAASRPKSHFEPDSALSTYFSFANAFLGSGGLLSSLNTSYEKLSPYQSAIYWRFLYEQCGGMGANPAAAGSGMDIVRQALVSLFSQEGIDITNSAEIVEHFPAIMDGALAKTPACPFAAYGQSLSEFAQALYALRLSGGRCLKPGLPNGCGFYDPYNLYARPAADLIYFGGEQTIYGSGDQMYPAGIRNSFGIDFVEIALDPSTNGQPLSIQFIKDPDAAAEFRIYLYQIFQPSLQSEGVPVTLPKLLHETDMNGRITYTLPSINISEANRLGLVVIRVDAHEREDPVGLYTVYLN